MTTLYHLTKLAGIVVLLLATWMIYSGWRQGKEMNDEEFEEWSGRR